uniref:Uncharacterized protein n=1 Tax=Siphoviridae sp. ctLdn10 TaxID=2827847 RepID=A0A8S5SQ83_9CAUD|nr:MAG TPA: hypothetical protein [Siphoviridae sp. ctLdn10]
MTSYRLSGPDSILSMTQKVYYLGQTIYSNLFCLLISFLIVPLYQPVRRCCLKRFVLL